MTFETIDWIEEAERLRRAFGVEEECEFIPKFGDKSTMEFVPAGNQFGFPDVNGALLSVTYRPRARTITIQNKGRGGAKHILPDKRIAQILWIDNRPISSTGDVEYSQWIAKALFHLNLLIPEVEAALGVSISAHQKLEWELEYAEKWGEVITNA